MSRTIRKDHVYRSPKNQNLRRANAALLADFREFEYAIARFNRIKAIYLNSVFDDIICSSYYERVARNDSEI
jgi:hypothetical protein